MKANLKKITKFIKRFFHRLDFFQLMVIPVLLLLLCFSIDLKSNNINVGVILPLSGNFKHRVQNHLDGINLAIRHINNQGGINNRKIELHIKDSNVNDITEATRDLIYDSKSEAILGGFTSEETRKIQYISERALIPFITGICTHFEIAQASTHTFRTITDDQHQFDILSSYSSSRYDIRRPAIIYDMELYGEESARKYSEISAKYYQQITSSVSFSKGTVNFKTHLAELFKSRPDSLVILAPAAESALIVRQAREMRFKNLIIGANQCNSSEFMQLAGIYSEGVITTLPYNPRAGGQLSDNFLNSFQEVYGHQADADAATGYESVMVLAFALENTANNQEQSLRESLASCHGWDSIIGSGGFDNYGNQVRPAEIAIIKEKQAIPVSLEGLF